MLLDFLNKCSSVTVVQDDVQQVNDALKGADGVVLSGSEHTLSSGHTPLRVVAANSAALSYDIPVLGVCFGMQVIALLEGGIVERLGGTCRGVHRTRAVASSMLLRGKKLVFDTYHEHDDAVTTLPIGYEETAWLEHADSRAIVAFESKQKKRFGVQFHPEAQEDTTQRVLARFVEICTSDRQDRQRRRLVGKVAGVGLLLQVYAYLVMRSYIWL